MAYLFTSRKCGEEQWDMPYICRHIKQNQFVKWGPMYPTLLKRRGISHIYEMIAIPYDVMFTLTKKKAYSGRMFVYNITLRKFTKDWFRLLKAMSLEGFKDNY